MNRNKRLLPFLLYILIVKVCSGQIVINEISANNVNEILSPTGDYDDWIELYNSGNTSVDLSGYGVTDNGANPYKFIIKSGIIAPGGYKLIFANDHDFNEQINHWEMAIDNDDIWNYFIGISQPDTNWRNLSFNDSAWTPGMGGVGFGDGDDNTSLQLFQPVYSVFIRKTFNVTDPSNLVSAILNVDYDDGFVAYLNGVEIARANVGSPNSRPTYDVLADTSHEAAMYLGGNPEYFYINPKLLRQTLVQGTNVLAVQVHNQDGLSSDMSSNVFLEFGVKSAAQTYSNVKAWFTGTQYEAYQAPFKLDRNGEEVFLYDSIGNLLDQQSFIDMQVDNSSGRKPNGGAWCSFSAPTPGSTNNGSTCYSGVCPVPVFSSPAGFYTSSFTLHATTTLTGSTIRYTLDGSDPKTNSAIFPAGGMSISNTKSIKAIVFASGYIPSPIVNNTYFRNQSAHLPSFCINTDPVNLFDSITGIYALGPNADTIYPYFGANYWQDWQKPAMLEYFDRGHVQQFQINADISMFGNYSRTKPQKSFEIRVNKNMGAGSVSYPILPDKPFLPPLDNFILRNSGTEWNITHFRDALLEKLMKNTYTGYLASDPVNVFINGAYWGVYDAYENHDQHFIDDNYGFKKKDIDYILEAGTLKTKLGSKYDFVNLVSYAVSASPLNSAYINTIDSQLDIKNFTDYMVCETYFDNEDWIGDWTNNIKMWRPVGGKWKFMLYDLDYTSGYAGTNAIKNSIQTARNPLIQCSTSDLFDAMLENPAYKNYFINRYADLINTIYIPDSVFKVEDSFKDSMQYDMPQHFTKWGSSVASWNNYISELENFFTDRPANIRNYIESEFAMNSQVDLTIDVSPAGAGRIQMNTIVPGPLPWTGVYFNGNPVTITAIPNPGYTFDHWHSNSGIPVNNPNQSVTQNFNLNDVITAYFTGTALSPSVVISEINYNSDSAFNTHDWIELHNLANFALDISQWSLRDSSDYHSYTFPVNTVIPPNGYIVAVEDNNSFSNLHPSVTNFTGPLGFNLSNGGDRLRLFDNNGVIKIDMSFDDKAPWPVTPDGDGYTLEVLNAGGNLSNAANWFAGCYGGSPGRAYSLPTAQISTPANTFICADSTMQLNALTNPFYSYQWQNHQVDIPGATSNNLIVDSAGVYSVVVSSQGCDVISGSISINELPHAAVPVVNDYSLCDSGQAVLQAVDTAVVHWYNNSSGGLPIATGPSYTTPLLINSMTYYADAGSVCPSARIPVNVNVHISPIVNLGSDTSVIAGAPVLLNAGPGFSSYLWSSGSTMQTYSTVSPDTVSVTVTDAFNCSGTDIIIISLPDGIDYLSNEGRITFYPNPVNDKLRYTLNRKQEQPITIQLIDPEGRILEEQVIKNRGLIKGEFEMSNYSKGVYIISVTNEIDKKQFKIVVD